MYKITVYIKKALVHIFLVFVILNFAVSMPGYASGLNITSVSAGDGHTVALSQNGSVWVWGFNGWGICGYKSANNTSSIVLTPNQIRIENVTAISAGGSFTMAQKSDGTVWTWGSNNHGQLGLGYLDIDAHPTPVMVLNLTNVTSISAGHDFALALRDDGTVWAWGSNDWGQLGDRKPVTQFTNDTGDVLSYYKKNTLHIEFPVNANSSNINLTYLYSQDTTTEDGWNPVPSHISSPVRVEGLKDIKYISTNYDRAIAIDNNDVIWGWGHYRVNYSTMNGFSSPTKLGTINNISTVSRDGFLMDNGTIIEILFNSSRLKNDPISFPYDFRAVSGLDNVKSISFGTNHKVALTNDGSVWTWGSNYYGQLGDGTNVSRSKPEKVHGLSHINNISAGGAHTIVLKDDGTMWGWGYDAVGQLGDGCSGLDLFKSLPVKATFTDGKSEAILPDTNSTIGSTPAVKSNNDYLSMCILLVLCFMAIILGSILYSKISKK